LMLSTCLHALRACRQSHIRRRQRTAVSRSLLRTRLVPVHSHTQLVTQRCSPPPSSCSRLPATPRCLPDNLSQPQRSSSRQPPHHTRPNKQRSRVLCQLHMHHETNTSQPQGRVQCVQCVMVWLTTCEGTQLCPKTATRQASDEQATEKFVTPPHSVV
jgi:hypothetical protein